MIVDCMTCPVRERLCDDCTVTALLAPRSADPGLPASARLDAAEARAVSLFVDAGLVNPRAVPWLRASRETEPAWGTARNVG